MNNEIQIFNNKQFGAVRIVMREDEPWFVAKDVCDALSLTDVSKTVALLEEDERGTNSIRTPSAEQEMLIISEPGLYSLVLRSRKPEAKTFKRWITHDVLPSLRNNGVYATESFLTRSISDPAWAIGVLQHLKFEQEKRALAERQRDEAIARRNWISNKREATAMSTAATQKKRAEKLQQENNRLENELGIGKDFKQIKAIPWLKEYFDLTKKGTYHSLGYHLTKFSQENNFDILKIESSQYGEINAYSVKAINLFQKELDKHPDLMSKYRNPENWFESHWLSN